MHRIVKHRILVNDSPPAPMDDGEFAFGRTCIVESVSNPLIFSAIVL